jgi:AraC family transcriptional regulator
MSTMTDTFARFVDVLADSLDDDDATGEALASRLHLSRFHLDRLISAAAGEHAGHSAPPHPAGACCLPPHHHGPRPGRGRPRRGLLVAEPFTRAFRRAYGQAPSRWRRRPTKFQIEAPSQVHFNPPGGLRVPAQRKVTAMDLLTRMLEHHVWLVGEMLSRAERLGDDVCSTHPSRFPSTESTGDDRPRAHVCRPPAHARPWRAGGRGHQRPRLG